MLEVTKGEGGHETYLFYPLQTATLESVRALPDWGKWRLAEDVYDSHGTNLLVQAWSLLATNLDRVAQLGIKEIRVADAQA